MTPIEITIARPSENANNQTRSGQIMTSRISG
jgi:hypothetical protein